MDIADEMAEISAAFAGGGSHNYIKLDNVFQYKTSNTIDKQYKCICIVIDKLMSASGLSMYLKCINAGLMVKMTEELQKYFTDLFENRNKYKYSISVIKIDKNQEYHVLVLYYDGDNCINMRKCGGLLYKSLELNNIRNFNIIMPVRESIDNLECILEGFLFHMFSNIDGKKNKGNQSVKKQSNNYAINIVWREKKVNDMIKDMVSGLVTETKAMFYISSLQTDKVNMIDFTELIKENTNKIKVTATNTLTYDPVNAVTRKQVLNLVGDNVALPMTIICCARLNIPFKLMYSDDINVTMSSKIMGHIITVKTHDTGTKISYLDYNTGSKAKDLGDFIKNLEVICGVEDLKTQKNDSIKLIDNENLCLCFYNVPAGLIMKILVDLMKKMAKYTSD